MKGWGSVASVAEALAEETDAEVARIREAAEAEVEALRRADASDPVRIPGRDTQLAAAHREAAEALARQDWADRCAALEDREAWIGRAVALGLERLREPGCLDPASLARLVREAAGHLPGTRFEVVLPEGSLPHQDDSAWRAVAESVGATLVRAGGNGDRPGSGCILRTPDGRVSFDNSFEARARRLEPAWRRRLVEIYSS